MTIHLPTILGQPPSIQEWRFDERDAILYALCLGLGSDPTDSAALRYVCETRPAFPLAVVPTFPTVLAWIAAPTFEELGVDPATALHGEQRIDVHETLRLPTVLRVEGRVVEVHDKGAGRGALVVTRHDITDARDGSRLVTLTTTCFARAEGGCGSGGGAPSAPHRVPARDPDHSWDFATPADLALLYRLTGDRNPLHADPAVARAAGFDAPLLHGLCSFGVTCRAVLETFTDVDAARIASHQARFASPVFPGETITVDLWRDADVVSFEARVKARDVVVLKHGMTVLRSPDG